ncbi:16S rRNA pseudouridine516 synthase [Breznakia sp. PF5-3]|uniref:pseudouridine synthase n=1 Tax=unclassified Breznakia TaxID=2623764 RepID=UPI0024067DAC|nr:MULTISPECIES: pseudouridine synthase [unclassified Breznakia]MDF9823891.1 16S rRNA pseudouridine516 synthase [Breznakia sp. PM6-1]MDF9834690.1 16S rRNA pseudouridine516 synthase [Breznakia sp. PF5-3]MDF9836875.1 16S rRNA pseudouridine516 synthase [Breznakia sp. PFB2-8]MDF9858892.1 16S rRNA pseudouridine516 synthase [Breznakia sp. PH5-24]
MIRLDKYLAHAKLGTRKEVKKLIRMGMIKVNGEVCFNDDMKIDENDSISYEDEIVSYQEYYYIMLNKPVDYLSSTIDEHYPSVLNLIYEDFAYDLFPVGRLDVDTVGLLILTNDGKLSHQLLSPKKHVEKEYYVELKEAITQKDIDTLEAGVQLDDEWTKPCKVIVKDERHVHIVICEGKFHQIKRMFHVVHNEVLYLKRIRMGEVWLDDVLEEGDYRPLTIDEIQALKGVTKK